MSFDQLMKSGQLYASPPDGVDEAVTAKLEARAEKMGADAVIAIGFTTSNVTEYGTEVIGYGTAVKFV